MDHKPPGDFYEQKSFEEDVYGEGDKRISKTSVDLYKYQKEKYDQETNEA